MVSITGRLRHSNKVWYRNTILVLVLFSVSTRSSASGTTANTSQYAASINQTKAFLQQLADARVVSGAVAIQKDGQLVYSDASGWASEELGVPMKDYHIFPIGSNTKFFTAVAIYQLQEKGLLNATDAVNAYIEPEDFQGLGQLGWCPVIYGKEQLGCQEPTIKQLLAMTSGLLPIDNLGCGTPNSTWTADDWFWQYRETAVNVLWGDVVGASGGLWNGSQTSAQLLNTQKSLLHPMLFAPGEQYCYTNTNFNIAAYIVEKLSNMSFTAYVTEHILKPANLTDTYYWLGGQGMEPQGIRKNVVSIPGYRTTFTDSTGSGPPFTFQKANRYPWWGGDLAFTAAAAGAMFSTTGDLLKWYNTFIAYPEVVGLSKESLRNLTKPIQPLGIAGTNAGFAQGIVATGTKNLTSKIEYIGGIWGFHTHIAMWLNANPTKAEAVLYFANVALAIPTASNGTCAVKSTADGSTVKLSKAACSGDMDDGTDLSSFVVTSLARMWNISQDAVDTD